MSSLSFPCACRALWNSKGRDEGIKDIFFFFSLSFFMKKIGLLSITEWSQARRLSVCINNKSQRRHSLHEKEVAAHSSSVDDGSNADSNISLCTVAQSQFSFLSLPSKALSPWNQVTKGWCEISPFWIGTSLWRRLCHQNLPGAYLAYICWWSVLQYNLGPMSLNKDVTYLTHCSHLGIFCGVYEKGKDYPSFHPSIHPLYLLLTALWVAGVLLEPITSCNWPKAEVKDADHQWLK